MLELRGLSAGYDRRPVVYNIDLDVRPGEIVALIGANGAGKSTLAKAISGLLPALAGTMRLDGRPATSMPVAARVRAGLAHVPEGRQVFATLTVEQNLDLGAYGLTLGRSERSAALEGVFARFPVLKARAQTPAGNLSGGQQQMLAIGRGLMARPKLIILDEPSLGLSPALVTEIFDLVASLRAQGLAVLLAEQNARQSLAIADRGYVMENGRIAAAGPARDLLASADIAARYLGLGEATAGADANGGRYARLTQLIATGGRAA